MPDKHECWTPVGSAKVAVSFLAQGLFQGELVRVVDGAIEDAISHASPIKPLGFHLHPCPSCLHQAAVSQGAVLQSFDYAMPKGGIKSSATEICGLWSSASALREA